MSKPNRNEIERNLLRTDHPLKDWRTQLSVLGWAFLKSSSAQYDDNAGVADFGIEAEYERRIEIINDIQDKEVLSSHGLIGQFVPWILKVVNETISSHS